MIYGVLCDGKLTIRDVQLKVSKEPAVVGFSVFA
jgi:hypothetical protein